MKNIERRTFTAELRASGEERSVQGMAAVYNSESDAAGWYTEVIAPGAFRKALERSPDVVALFNHDENIVLGRTSSGTLHIEETDEGLRYHIPNMPKTREDILEAIERGDINKSSFAFTIAKGGDVWEERNGKQYRTIKEFDQIWDVSPVTRPFYTDSSVAKRSFEMWSEEHAPKEDPQEMKVYHDNLKRKLTLMGHFL